MQPDYKVHALSHEDGTRVNAMIENPHVWVRPVHSCAGRRAPGPNPRWLLDVAFVCDRRCWAPGLGSGPLEPARKGTGCGGGPDEIGPPHVAVEVV